MTTGIQTYATQAIGWVKDTASTVGTAVVNGAKKVVAMVRPKESTDVVPTGLKVESTGVATVEDNAEKVVGGFVAMTNGLTEAGEVDTNYDNVFAELISSNFSSNPVFMSHYNKGLETSYGETFATDGVTRVMDALLAS